MEKNNRVLLGMSGGTDSSVAALLLLEAGYEVTGITFRFYEKDNNTEYLDDAADLCKQLGIPHIIYDAREKFNERIVRYFIDEYLKGRTPVPCTLCNNYLKWPLLQEVADKEGIYYLATGHYVQKRFIDGFWHITNGADPDKDQSFFLWGLPQYILERMLLPMGNITKSFVREYASQRGFHKAANKKDSLSICFCPMDYRSFLRANTEADSIRPGFFYDEQHQVIGKHEGYPFYTIGQRRGLGIHLNKALFVKDIDPITNNIIISDNLRSLEKDEFWLSDWNISNPEAVLGKDDVIVKIRYRKQANRCSVTLTNEGLLHIQLHEPLASVAAGQAAALYREDCVLGGGIIETTKTK